MPKSKGRKRKQSQSNSSAIATEDKVSSFSYSSPSTDDASAEHVISAQEQKEVEARQSKNNLTITQAIGILFSLILAFVSGSSTTFSPLRETQDFLDHYVCDAPKGYCHENLQSIPERRTHNTKKRIAANETILVLPKSLLITDLDALLDPYMETFYNARHSGTNNTLDSGAFLALYLLKVQRLESKHKKFLEILPGYQKLSFHPVTWNPDEVKSLLGNETLATQTILAFRDMIQSEYSSFLSLDSTSTVEKFSSLETYIAMRINVMARSFGTGPPKITPTVNAIRKKTDIPIELGCRAMSPILDMWDHHYRPNVQWRYDEDKEAFVVTSIFDIPKNQDIMVSYGRYTDTHLFAKFGFVNGDGSGWTEINLNAYHSVHDIVGLGKQFSYEKKKENFKDLMRYLQLDEGYTHCISPSNSPKEEIEIKRLKYKHLKFISQRRSEWIVRVPPRNTTSEPAQSSDVLITNMIPNFHKRSKVEFRHLLSTCRLIALHHEDYNGTAIETLQHHLIENPEPLLVSKQSHQHEFFALSCLERLASISLRKYHPFTIEQDMNYLKLYQHKLFRSNLWNAIHVRLAEMQTLEVLRNVALSGMQQMLKLMKEKDGIKDLGKFKKKNCHFNLTMGVLMDEKNSLKQ